MTRPRRRVLQGVGALGIAGVAGCMGGDDSDDDDGNGDDGNGADDGNGDDEPAPEPAHFEVTDISAADNVTRGDEFSVTATVENTGEEDGEQDVEFFFDDESADVSSASISSGDSATVSFETETADLEPDDYDYEVTTDDDEESGTVTVEALLPDDPLVAFGDDPVVLRTGANTVGAILSNPYALALEEGTVTVEGPDGWEISAGDGTTFETLEADSSQDATWEVTVPDDAGGEAELDVAVSYSTAGEEADVTFTQAVEVVEFLTTPEPVHHWPMDEGEGETVADAVGDEDGVLAGAEWATPEWTDGAALESDGEGTAQLTDLEGFVESLNGNFAVAYTIESEDTSDEAGVLSARDGNASGPGWAVLYSNGWFGVSQGVGMTLHDGSGDGEESTIVTTENGLLDGGPHRVVINKVTNDSEAWEIYVDGQQVESEVPLWGGDFPANNFEGIEALPTEVQLFDHDLDGDRGLEGTLDELQLFDKPLADSAVVEDYEHQPWADEVGGDGEQFYWSAEDYDVGENPDDSWEPIGVDEWDIREDDDGQYVAVGAPTESTYHLQFTGAPEATDTEVYATIKPIGNWSDHWVFVRDPDPTEGDAVQFRADTNFAEWTNAHLLQGEHEGEHQALGEMDLVPGVDELYHVRVQYHGDTLRVKWWVPDEDEPDEWDLEAQPDTDAQFGYTGIGRWNGDPFHVYEYSVGTGGESAPSE